MAPDKLGVSSVLEFTILWLQLNAFKPMSNTMNREIMLLALHKPPCQSSFAQTRIYTMVTAYTQYREYLILTSLAS